MPHGRCRIVSTVAAAHAVLLAAGATPVHAAPAVDRPPTIASVRTPKVVVLPASTKPSVTTSVRITLRVADSDGVDTVVAGLYPPGGKKGIAVRAKRTGGSAGSGVWTATARHNGTATPGTWTVQAFATDREQRTSDPTKVYATYEVRTPTRVRAFDIGEPVEVGKPVRVRGTLERYAGKNGWKPYAGREIALQFRAEGRKAWTTADTGKTGTDGTVTGFRTTVDKPGTWRLSFAGHETRAASVSREDEVQPTAPKPAEPETPKEPAERGTEATPSPGATPSPTPRPVESAKPSPSVPSTATPRPTATPGPTAGSSRPARERPRQPGTRATGSPR
jgi:hypothetical protein